MTRYREDVPSGYAPTDYRREPDYPPARTDQLRLQQPPDTTPTPMGGTPASWPPAAPPAPWQPAPAPSTAQRTPEPLAATEAVRSLLVVAAGAVWATPLPDPVLDVAAGAAATLLALGLSWVLTLIARGKVWALRKGVDVDQTIAEVERRRQEQQ